MEHSCVGFNLKKYKYEYKRGEEEYKLYRIDTKNKNVIFNFFVEV